MADFSAQTDVPNKFAPASGLHLYHFPVSSCSQKVRLVLEEKEAKWESHVIFLPMFEQFDPEYVRINPRCVVPTLVRDGLVTTDSYNILNYIDEHIGTGVAMRPIGDGEAAAVESFCRLADGMPMEAVTYGPLDGVKKPFLLRRAKGSHEKKVEFLRKLIEKHKQDTLLTEVYETKLASVEKTKETLHSPDKMAAVVARIDSAIGEVEQQLRKGCFQEGGWLCSEGYSLADVEWAVLLYRFQWLGLGPQLWGERELVGAYAQKLFSRPSFDRAVLQWSQPLTRIILPLLRKRFFG